MNNKFLTPRENRCKWFNNLKFMRKWVYIERGTKFKFSFENNYVNRFIKCLNRFIQFDSKLGKRQKIWRLMCIMQALNRFKRTQDEDWYDSMYFESIQHKSKRLWDMIQSILSQFKSESIQGCMNRFTQSQKLCVMRFRRKWIDSHMQKMILTMWMSFLEPHGITRC